MAIEKVNTAVHIEGTEIIANIFKKCDEKSTNTVTVTIIEINQMSSYVRWSILLCSREN
jgi:hypothetical protein